MNFRRRFPTVLYASLFSCCVAQKAAAAGATTASPRAAFTPPVQSNFQQRYHQTSDYKIRTLSGVCGWEQNVCHMGSNRMGSLALRSSSTNNESRTRGKDRGKELANLASTMNVDSAKLKEMLSKQRSKMDAMNEKAQYIDWLLSNEEPKDRNKGGALAKQVTPAGSRVSNTVEMKPTKLQKSNAAPTQERKSSRIRPKRPAAVDEQVEARQAEAKRRQEEALKDPTLLTNVHFAERKDLHPASKRALTEVMGLTSMTEIQAKTYAAASSGRDVLGRARTGTGKTVAFLLPAIERVLQSAEYHAGRNVGVLIVSPTRELATQIGDQAEKLLTFHPDMTVQVVFGGTKMGRDVNQFKRRLPTILVATPGRLLDHLESTNINGRKFGDDIMCNTPVVVLDETDRLLDMGFRREIKKILSFLPRGQKRQTLLFSATIPRDLKTIMAETMKDDFVEVDCINDGDGASHTNARVEQSHVVIPSIDRYVSSVVEIVRLAIQDGGVQGKIVVFFPTARMVAFFAELFNEGLDIPVIELHSKKSQGYRNRASEKFRSASSGVLFTSDVSARGVDYPGVSHVIQFGIPESREQYIHRLGRTGRAGGEGKGWMVLGPFESLFLEELKGLKIPRDDRLVQLLGDPVSAETEEILQPALGRIRGGDRKLEPSAQGAYQAFLGYYLGQMKRMKMKRKDELVSLANEFSSQMGLSEIPGLTKNMVGKMGLKGVHGIVVKTSSDEDGRHHGGGGGGRKNHVDGRRAPNSGRRRRRG